MTTEFNDSLHYGLFVTGTTLTSETGKYARLSELVLAALRAAGLLDNMEDGTTPPATSKLWLDKSTDPAVLKEWDTTGSSWAPMTFKRIFERASVTVLTVTGGTANALTVSQPSGFIQNRLYSVSPTLNNAAGPTTIAVSGVGTFGVKYIDGTDINAGEFAAGRPSILIFRNSRFELLIGNAALAAEAGAIAAQEAAEAAYASMVEQMAAGLSVKLDTTCVEGVTDIPLTGAVPVGYPQLVLVWLDLLPLIPGEDYDIVAGGTYNTIRLSSGVGIGGMRIYARAAVSLSSTLPDSQTSNLIVNASNVEGATVTAALNTLNSDVSAKREVYDTKTSLGEATVDDAIKSVFVQGGTAIGDMQGGPYARTNSQPSHHDWIRSQDRYKADGTTSSTNGGYWERIFPEGRPLVVVCWGQSNMRGTEDQTGGDLTVNPQVLAWGSQASPMSNGTAFVVATPGDDPFIGFSDVCPMSLAIARELQETTGRRVYLFVAALGGHSIEAHINDVDLAANGWTRPGGDANLFDHLKAQLDAGLSLVPEYPGYVDYWIGHQGEANKTDQVEVYAKKLRYVLKRWSTNGRLSETRTKIVMGEILDATDNGRGKDRHAAALRRLQMGTDEDAFPTFKIAASHGIQPVSQINNIHASGAAISAFAKGYVDAARTEQPAAELDPTLCDLSVDSGLGWVCPNITSQSHISYWRRGAFYLADTPVTIEDNATIGWCHVVPASTQVVLAGRKMFRVPKQLGFTVEMELRNDHPSASATLRVGVHEFDEDKVYQAANNAADITISASTTSRVFVTFANAASSLTPDKTFGSTARWFAPLITINPGSVGAGLRFNFLNMSFY